MEIRITTNQILKVLQILAWIIFFGLSMEAGAFIVNTVISLFFNPAGVRHFWSEPAYFSGLLHHDKSSFIVVTTLITIVALLKSTMFYLIIELFSEKHFDISKPFNHDFRKFISRVSYLSLAIGLFSYSGAKYISWLAEKDLPAVDLNPLHLSGADVWIFMAIILFVISHIIKKGIEIQTENDLTI